jgi:hypothetical protein
MSSPRIESLRTNFESERVEWGGEKKISDVMNEWIDTVHNQDSDFQPFAFCSSSVILSKKCSLTTVKTRVLFFQELDFYSCLQFSVVLINMLNGCS